jgi:hypothetical protein
MATDIPLSFEMRAPPNQQRSFAMGTRPLRLLLTGVDISIVIEL